MRRSVTWFLSTLESYSGKPEAGPTGVVESPTVRIDGREVAFWIGGGKRGSKDNPRQALYIGEPSDDDQTISLCLLLLAMKLK